MAPMTNLPLPPGTRVVIPGFGTPYKLGKALAALATLGVGEVLVTCSAPADKYAVVEAARAMLPSRSLLGVTVLKHDLRDPDALFAEIKRHGRIDGIYTPRDTATGLTNALGLRLFHAGLMPMRPNLWDQKTLDDFKSKWEWRQRCNRLAAALRSSGEPGLLAEVWAQRFNAATLSAQRLRKAGAPDTLVLVPERGAGSLGVKRIRLDDPNLTDTLRRYRQELLGLHDHPIATPGGFDHVVGVEYFAGAEFNLDGWIQGGETFVAGAHLKTDIDRGRGVVVGDGQFISQGDRFLEGAKVAFPLIEDVGRRLVKAAEYLFAGCKDGPFHLELRWNPESGLIYPLEPNMQRPCGAILPDSLRRATGHDIALAQAAIALGVPYPLPATPQHFDAAGEITVFAEQAGTVQKLTLTLGDQVLDAGRMAPDAIMARFNAYLATLDRAWVQREILEPYLASATASPLYSAIAQAFDTAIAGGRGLHAALDTLMVWLRPGNRVQAVDADYVADAVTSLADTFPSTMRGTMTGVAEVVAAQALFQRAFRSIVG